MDLVRPDYDGGCVVNLTPALIGGRTEDWFPAAASGARATVLLVLDGLGWSMVRTHATGLPILGTLDGGPITTVAPSTTTTAMTSITTGLPPAEHGVVAYRMRMEQGILNTLRWTIQGGRTEPPDPEDVQPREAFAGQPVPVVTRAEFKETGFTGMHLRGARWEPWHSPSGLAVRCRALVDEGERFVFAYYGFLDIICHVYGFPGPFFDAEMAFCDRLLGELLDALPDDVALLVTADHGHVAFTEHVSISPLNSMVAAYAGEARFRYLYAKRGAADDLLEAAVDHVGEMGWVLSREQIVDEGWLGPKPPSASVHRRIGDVVIAARQPLGFADPTNRGEAKMVSGHGSLTEDEMLVPLLGARGRAPG